MKKYLQMIIGHYQKKGEPIICGNLKSVLEIMKGYGFNVNFDMEKRN
jgi:hypothetical protein